jgi:photosystem II stability/assembly factor-like uncharacterized protein
MTRYPNRILFGLGLGTCLVLFAQSVGAQAGSERKEDVRAREEYFWFQRSYPSTDRPYAQMERARASVSAQGQRLFNFTAGVAGGWRSLGPNGVFGADNGFSASSSMLDIGRVTAIAPSSAGSLFIATASGGVWRSAVGGYWSPLTDDQCNLTIGALTLDDADPNVVFAATGEYNVNSWGCGILRSTDGGTTWSQLGATSFRVTSGGIPRGSASFGRIVVRRPAGGFVANTVVIGGSNVGVFRSTDGGSTWSYVLVGATASVVGHPTQPTTFYAGNSDFATASHRGVYKSTDNGATWTVLPALPGVTVDNLDRVELATTPAAPNLVYAAVGNPSGGLAGLFVWDDAAGTWTRLAAGGLNGGLYSNDFGNQSWYDLALAVDPRNANRIYLAGIRGFKSDDGGATFTPMGGEVHVDWHSIAIDPVNPDIIYAGTDGGAFVSTDQGNNWVSRNAGLTVTQYYPGISVTPNGSQIMGGSQDNGTQVYTGSMFWNGFLGGDGGYTAINYSNPDIIYGESQWDPTGGGAYIIRYDGSPTVNSSSKRTTGIAAGDRAAFLPPYIMDPVTPTKLYFGTQKLYRTLNEGTLWTAISGDLTKGSGYITAIAVSSIDPRVIYVGASDGMVNVSRDGGATYTPSTTGLPNRYVTHIAVDPTDGTHALLTVSGFSSGHVFETRNAGGIWTDVSAGLVDAPANAVAFVPGIGIMVGTDVGVFQTASAGNSWVGGPAGLPNVIVQDLVYAPGANLLLAGTYGRGMFAYTVGGEPAVLRGDVNTDGKVDAFDALLIQQSLVGSLPVSTQVYPRGDADCNFAIQSADAVYVLRTAVGLASPGVCVNTTR